MAVTQADTLLKADDDMQRRLVLFRISAAVLSINIEIDGIIKCSNLDRAQRLVRDATP